MAGHTSATVSCGKKDKSRAIDAEKLWKGWILPATPADSWLAAGSTLYWKALTSENPDKTVESYRTQLRGIELTHDRPLLQMNGDVSSTAWASVTALKGALFLAALRKEMGSDEFLNFLNGFFDAHTTRTVTTAAFLNALDQKWKEPDDELVTTWLKRSGLPGAGNGPLYVARLSQEDLSNTVIVYGTLQKPVRTVTLRSGSKRSFWMHSKAAFHFCAITK
jgi:aminopeptidase N